MFGGKAFDDTGTEDASNGTVTESTEQPTYPAASASSRRQSFLERHRDIRGVLLGSFITLVGTWSAQCVQLRVADRQLDQTRAERQQREAAALYEEVSRSLNSVMYWQKRVLRIMADGRLDPQLDSAVASLSEASRSWDLHAPRYRAMTRAYFGEGTDSALTILITASTENVDSEESAVAFLRDPTIKAPVWCENHTRCEVLTRPQMIARLQRDGENDESALLSWTSMASWLQERMAEQLRDGQIGAKALALVGFPSGTRAKPTRTEEICADSVRTNHRRKPSSP